MTFAVEHLFICFFAVSEMSVQTFSPFLIGLFCTFLWLSFQSSSYTLDTSSSSDSVLQYILLFCGTPFHFINNVFGRADIFEF